MDLALNLTEQNYRKFLAFVAFDLNPDECACDHRSIFGSASDSLLFVIQYSVLLTQTTCSTLNTQTPQDCSQQNRLNKD